VSLPTELITALGGLGLVALGLLTAFLKAWGDKMLAELKVNTDKTHDAKVAAEKVADQMDWRQRATTLSLENDELRRQLALVQGLPDCQDCRLKIAEVLRRSPVLRRRDDPPPGEKRP